MNLTLKQRYLMLYHSHLHELAPAPFTLNIRTFLPSPSLSHFVSHYVILTRQQQLCENTQWYLLPDNSTYLIFYLLDQGNTIVPKWMIVGPRSKSKIINRKDRLFTFIVSFKPGALKPFVGCPINELRDIAVDARSLLTNYQQPTFEQLIKHALNSDVKASVRTLEAFLVNFLPTTSGVHDIVTKFYHQYLERSTRLSLADVSREFGYSERQLRNLIQANIGNSPNTVAQIERLTMSLKQVNAGQNWASIAHLSGYYDQSHMISDYRRLIGISPQKLFS